MMIELYLKGKQNKNKECNAIGEYNFHTNHLIVKDTFNKLGYKTKINTHTTSYIN